MDLRGIIAQVTNDNKYGFVIILWRIDPLLCNERNMGGYTRVVSGQRLGKHFPIATQYIFINATVGLQQWKTRVFYVVRAEKL
jgi:hypothetical protein